MASRKHHSPEDIVRLLHCIDELLGNGFTIELAGHVPLSGVVSRHRAGQLVQFMQQ